jgi:hypothetical protein
MTSDRLHELQSGKMHINENMQIANDMLHVMFFSYN